MIKDEIVAKRYADAFLAYAKDHIGFEKGLDELQNAKRVIRDNGELMDFFESLDITDSEKSSVVEAVFREGFTEELRHFLKLLVEKRRIGLFIDIAEYARINYAHGVEVDALLKTSYPLETEDIQAIKDALERRLRRKLHLYVELDADLVGGVCAKVGNIIIDGSVRKRLEDLREKLDVLKVA